jgi:hypothetical protein
VIDVGSIRKEDIGNGTSVLVLVSSAELDKFRQDLLNGDVHHLEKRAGLIGHIYGEKQ